MFEGPPGQGKSRLLSEAAHIAREEGLEVLTAVGLERETEFTFGGALQLFEARVGLTENGERGRLLSGPARLARPLLGDGSGEALPDGQAFSLHHGLFGLCSDLAEIKPLVLCVDDAQWLDVPTLRFLLYAIERVADLPVVILMAAGPDTRGTGADLLAEIACRASTEVVHLAGLTPDAIVGVLGAYLPGDVQRVFAEAVTRPPTATRS